MSKVLKSPTFFQVPAALIDWVLSFQTSLIVFAGLNTLVKKEVTFAIKSPKFLYSALYLRPCCFVFIFEELSSVVETYTSDIFSS